MTKRHNGPGDILALIRRGHASTRGEVREATGLSRSTVASRIDALLASGLLREDPGGAATGGRRPLLLRFDENHGVVGAAGVDTTHTVVGVLDLSGRVLREHAIDLHVTDGPDLVLKTLEDLIASQLKASGWPPDRLEGVGVSLPAPIHPATGRPSRPPIMPGWDDCPVREHLQARFDVPVMIENDANAMAAGEHAVNFPDCPALSLVKVSTGIGAGIVINGSVYTGIDGGAGDIGHVRVAGESAALCRCGSRGCLAALASGQAVAGQLSEVGIPATHGRDVAVLLAAGDPVADRLVRNAGRRIGEVLAMVLSVLNPGVLVVAGDLASDALVSGIRETLYPRMLPRATRNLEIRLGRLGEHSAIVGLTRLVVEHVLDPATIDQRIPE